ncbi:MAG: hypothetical protein AAGC56_05925 [Pseudomonadota bacterium]
MAEIITAPLVSWILIGVAVEALAIAGLLAARGAERLIAPAILFLASGSALMLALRFSLVGATGAPLSAAMLTAFLLHISFFVAAARAARLR